MCCAHAAPVLPVLTPRAAPAPAPPLPRPALACSCLSTLRRRRPSRHTSRRLASSCSRATTPSSGPRAHPGAPHTLALAFAHAHFAHFSLSRPPHHTGPPPRPLAAVASHPRRLPPVIQCSSSTVATPCRLLTHPISLFHTRASSLAARRAQAPPPLGLAVDPTLHRLSASAKGNISTTSTRRSFLAASPPPSGTLGTGTPSTPLGALPPARLHRRYAATAPLCLNPGHPRDRRELLNIPPHLPLAAGELPQWIWSPPICPLCKTQLRTYL
jgi:hypothetical protein